MSEIEILDSSVHTNSDGQQFVVAIVDDTNDGRVKLVVMFDEEGYTAVLDLDTIIEEEDISAKKHTHCGAEYDELLREALWDN
jgi:hypothetical protein